MPFPYAAPCSLVWKEWRERRISVARNKNSTISQSKFNYIAFQTKKINKLELKVLAHGFKSTPATRRHIKSNDLRRSTEHSKSNVSIYIQLNWTTWKQIYLILVTWTTQWKSILKLRHLVPYASEADRMSGGDDDTQIAGRRRFDTLNVWDKGGTNYSHQNHKKDHPSLKINLLIWLWSKLNLSSALLQAVVLCKRRHFCRRIHLF